MTMVPPPDIPQADPSPLVQGFRPDHAEAGTEPPGVGVGPEGDVQPRGLLRRGWDVFAENRLALASLVIVLFMLAFCFIGPLFYHTDQVHTNLDDYLCHPSSAHLLGCDNLGYDELGRLMAGGQTSLEVGLAAALVSVVFGALYGAFSGFIGGPTDALLMRIVDAGLSIPYLMLVIILSVILQPDTVTMIFIIAVIYWLGVARLVRGETLTLRTREYVQAVKVMGGQSWRSIARHILPNAAGTIIVQATFAVADSIGLLALLGFLGLGVSAPATDWGSMLSNGLQFLQSSENYWWLIYPPGLAIIITCLSFNFIGDALRDAFETRLQRR
jgi:peptide/nickel transport system permease protein